MQMVETPSGLISALESGQRLLGLDLGSKTIGLALGDSDHKIATPYDTIRRKKFGLDAAALGDIIKTENIGGLVMGLPLNMDGSESELSRLARKFARRLQGRFNMDVLMVDERLTSRDAKSKLRDAGSDRQSGRIDLTKIDHLAAAIILKSWLDQPTLGQNP